jgi:hypothetical protein
MVECWGELGAALLPPRLCLARLMKALRPCDLPGTCIKTPNPTLVSHIPVGHFASLPPPSEQTSSAPEYSPPPASSLPSLPPPLSQEVDVLEGCPVDVPKIDEGELLADIRSPNFLEACKKVRIDPIDLKPRPFDSVSPPIPPLPTSHTSAPYLKSPRAVPAMKIS